MYFNSLLVLFYSVSTKCADMYFAKQNFELNRTIEELNDVDLIDLNLFCSNKERLFLRVNHN